MDRIHPGVYSTALLALGLMFLVTAGCREGMAVADPSRDMEETFGIITGTIRAPQATPSLKGRVVELIGLDTNERQRTTTSHAGGFTFRVKPGKYHVQVTLHDGESIIKQPGVMTVHRSDADAHADFTIGVIRVLRRNYRAPASIDPALGFPIG